MHSINPVDNIRGGTAEPVAAVVEILRTRQAERQSQQLPAIEEEEGSGAVDERDAQPRPSPRVARPFYAEFVVNQDNGDILVRIIDAENGELVRTVPADKLAEEIAKGSPIERQLRRRDIQI